MKWLVKILNAPYPYYIPFSRSIKLLIIFSVIIPLFLIVFEPFGLSNWKCEQKNLLLSGLSMPIFITLAFNFYGVSKLIPAFFSEDSWNIWKEMLWSFWNFFTIFYTTSLYWTMVPVCASTYINWEEQLLRAFLIGLLPGMICIYFNYNRSLGRKLKKAQTLNIKLQEKISYYEHGKLTLFSENKTEAVNMTTDNLILIQSYDNYSKIIWQDHEKIDSQLIRSSLKHVEQQIEYPFILRCHRSFIINLAKVDQVIGNARDFKLKLKNYDEWIPVSREAYKKINGLFKKFTPQTNTPVAFSLDKESTQV